MLSKMQKLTLDMLNSLENCDFRAQHQHTLGTQIFTISISFEARPPYRMFGIYMLSKLCK